MRRRDFLAGTPGLWASAARAQARRTKHIFLVTSDGVRWQDLFTGIDPQLMDEKTAGMSGQTDLRDRLWMPSAGERRAALMPFFWNTLVPQGVLLGNCGKDCPMQVSNAYRVSYPGYSEILTGRTQDSVIRDNKPIRNPTASLFQFLKERSHLRPEQIAVFASWKVFHAIAESRAGDLFINAGYEKCPLPKGSDKTALLNQLQWDARFPDSSSRHDAFTFELAMEFLERLAPEHLYIALDETDDWAHQKRYDQVLQSLEYFDQALRRIWNFIRNSPKYRDRTTLVITTDHGRGSTVDDWSNHGPKVPGDEQIWAVFAGPDTPAKGELSGRPVRYQRDIAPTILELLGIAPSEYAGVQGSAIPEAFL